MGIISIENADHLYWLGRYTERVYTTLRVFFHIYDQIIEQPEGIYGEYCERLNIPNIYQSNRQFVQSYLFEEENPDSVFSNMKRAYDNAIVLRNELSSTVLSYIQLAWTPWQPAGGLPPPYWNCSRYWITSLPSGAPPMIMWKRRTAEIY